MAKFRASARTVDMLGRQQIAGVPTAISELFKNAHDAYAEHVEVDFFRSSGLFVLRDDGVGMTPAEFQDRWLVLGTESKVAGSGMEPPYRPTDQPIRPVLGEKGIGRLAIGAIGPQVLVMSRATRDGALDDLVTAFINWGFFELPGVTLEDIEVPIEIFPGGTLPSNSDVQRLVDRTLSSFAAAEARGIAVPESVAQQLADFASTVDPLRIQQTLGGPSLLKDGHGTHFVILPSAETLATDIDAGRNIADAAPPLTKFLLGFTNTMTPDAPLPRIRTAFRDWRNDTVPDDLISESAFFTKEEFSAADHHISGRFDLYGQFQGSVTIYGREPETHSVAFTPARGRPTECGPFSLEVAVVQGNQPESKLDPESWARLTAKMAQIGGLYIYRDGIRVLPYGNNDYDFIDIERNRTKSAARYYFSYRRMFGVVQLTSEQNRALQEKAGREGFRENKAYGQFRDILKNFFLQTAVTFFREEGSASDAWREERQKLQAADAERLRQERLRSQRRREFDSSLRERSEEIASDVPARRVDQALVHGEALLWEAASISDPAEASAAFVRAEQEARRELEQVRASYRIQKPVRIGLSKALDRDWRIYRSNLERLDDELFAPASLRLATTADEVAQTMQAAVDRRMRLDEGVRAVVATGRSAVRARGAEIRVAVDALTSAAQEVTSEAIRELDLTAQQVLSSAASLDVTQMDEAEFDRTRKALEQSLEELSEATLARFAILLSRLSQARADLESKQGIYDVEALDQDELLALRERADTDLELMQLGSAIQVINHEFLANVKAMRSNLRQLKKWADKNVGLARVYRDLRTSFDHLDGYLQLFTPLQRRLERTKVIISGGEIEKFVRDLFEERLERHSIRLEATYAFRTHRFSGYPSTFYPVFINLIDNAIWWVQDAERRIVQLDVLGNAMIVRDSGPGIHEEDLDDVFDLGFTRKPMGRGTGLFVSRQVLRREGYDLRAGMDSELGGARFQIAPMDQEDEQSRGLDA